MIFAIRHGQRADDPCSKDPTYIELDYDPPLSTNGLSQAHLTGLYLRETLSHIQRSSGEKQKVVVLSSPFLRCIQTAIYLSKALDYFHKNTIYITDEISEIQKSKFFSKDVLPDLHFRRNAQNKNFSEFINGKEIIIKEKCFMKKLTSTSKNSPVFPESIADCSMRFKKARKNINQKYLRQNFSNTIVILVTHSIGVQCMIHELEPEKEIPQIGYCSMTQITYKVDLARKEVVEEISVKNFNEHIKIKESQ